MTPRINPVVAIGLERFRAEIETAKFVSREFNEVLPALIVELLRIVREVSR